MCYYVFLSRDDNDFKQNYLGSGHRDIVIASFPNKLVSILRNFTLNSNFLKFPSLSNLLPYAHFIRKMCGFGFLYSGTRLTFAFLLQGQFRCLVNPIDYLDLND